jgi:hypothetical protein
MNEKSLRDLWDTKYPDRLGCASLIRVKVKSGDTTRVDDGELGVVLRVGENLASNWQSGDIIAFWSDGEHTALDGLEFDIVTEDLFG